MTMMPGHPRWDEFLDLLTGEHACNFQGDPKKPESVTWTCHNDFRFARTVLGAWDDIKLEASITYFELCGAGCDCEIIFNMGGDD